jgi:hypothetical protein
LVVGSVVSLVIDLLMNLTVVGLMVGLVVDLLMDSTVVGMVVGSVVDSLMDLRVVLSAASFSFLGSLPILLFVSCIVS